MGDARLQGSWSAKCYQKQAQLRLLSWCLENAIDGEVARAAGWIFRGTKISKAVGVALSVRSLRYRDTEKGRQHTPIWVPKHTPGRVAAPPSRLRLKKTISRKEHVANLCGLPSGVVCQVKGVGWLAAQTN
ncbi:hypothetical protein L1987_61902 [Smallanthus sonchifolius]|uniref:Uncharacterized protein n=1 Tax=Smallanthus sonchifolius TaxID=185202 RepID=A0ACB9C8W0_9ASTR|nr:hypothetical protein L1987_61902 [Smallanthus sonchifolius]